MQEETLISPKIKKIVTSFKVNGITFKCPHPPPIDTIDGFNLKKTDQYFRRKDIPSFMNDITWKDDIAVWNKEQTIFMEREYSICKHDGYWFMVNGTATYITGLHYFYLTYYTLEDGTKPDYRDTDRRFFYFLSYCLTKGYIKGIIRLKKRREGATSQICCWLLWTAIFFQNSNCGIVSDKEENAYAAYNDMVFNQWESLHPFLKPEHDRSTTKKIVLKKNKTKKGAGIEGGEFDISNGGMNSKISHRATTLNAYDSGRLTALLIDESCKWMEVNILEYVPKVQKTMMQGVKRVGFCVLPTTMNPMEKGGKNFVTLYKASNQFDIPGGRTDSGLYKYFIPAYDGFPGFIGKYGESIIDEPTRPQLSYLISHYSDDMDLTKEDLHLGAKKYLLKVRESIKDPILLAEEIRSNPFNEDELLYSENRDIYFNATILKSQLKAIEEKKPYIRIGRLYEDYDKKIQFSDDPNSYWHFLEFPRPEIQNVVMNMSGWMSPLASHENKIGVDPFRNSLLSYNSKGSNGTIVIIKSFNAANPELGGYPIAFYRYREKSKPLFYKQVEYAMRFCSARACIESDIDDFLDYFIDRKMKAFCEHTPGVVIDSSLTKERRDNKRHMWGVKSGDPFALSKELELAQLFVQNHGHKIWFRELIEDLIIYDHQNRTKSDLTVAFMMAICQMAATKTIEQQDNIIHLDLPTYDLSKYRNYNLVS